MKRAWRYEATLFVALIGLVLAGIGLMLAMLSNPARFSDNVQNDRIIDAYAGGGFLCAVLGVGVFLLAVSRMRTSLSPEKRRQTNAAIGMGLVFQLAGIVMIQMGLGQSGLGWALVVASFPLFVLGAMYYAQAKGYSRQFGALGIFGVIGLIVLILLPGREMSERAENES